MWSCATAPRRCRSRLFTQLTFKPISSDHRKVLCGDQELTAEATKVRVAVFCSGVRVEASVGVDAAADDEHFGEANGDEEDPGLGEGQAPALAIEVSQS